MFSVSDNPSRHTEFKSKLDELPHKPPQTTLQILNQGQREKYWQRLLFHFLSPHKRHGLEHTLLEQLLNELSKRDDINGSFPLHNPDDIQIELEVDVQIRDDGADRRVDAVMWSEHDWFICWELKVEGSEEHNQTRDYVNAESFQNIELEKNDVPSDGHHYIYLAEENAPDPEAEEFVSTSWGWIASQITSFLKESTRTHPTRTTLRLLEFCDTISSELNLSKYQRKITEPYIEYFDVVDSLKKNNEYTEKITELEDAFDAQLDQFLNTWGSRLGKYMDTIEPVEDLPTKNNDVAIELDHPSVGGEEWVLQQGDPYPYWVGMFKRGWWRRDDDDDDDRLSNSYTENDSDVRITFYHNLNHQYEQKKKDMIEDRELEVWLYHGGSNEVFQEKFNQILETKIRNSGNRISSSVSVGGGRAYKSIKLTSDIPIRERDGFFEAYVAAWSSIIDDILIDNHEIISLIDDAYEQSLSEFY